MSDCHSPLVRLYDVVRPSMLLLAWVFRSPSDAARAAILIEPAHFSSAAEAELLAYVVQRVRSRRELRQATPNLAHSAAVALELRAAQSPLAALATRVVEVPIAAIEAAGSVDAIATAMDEERCPRPLIDTQKRRRRAAWNVHLSDAVGQAS